MKRDWDLIREQLLAIEEGKDFKATVLAEVPERAPEWRDNQTEADHNAAMEDYHKRSERVFGHLQLLIESGYVDGIKVQQGLSNEYMFSLWSPRLTMAGHDLLDTMRSKRMWETIKSTAKSKGLDLTFDTIKAIAAAAVKGLLG
jgi:hypothetical protein